MIEKKLGKIQKVEFGLNDRDWLGISFVLGGEGWGVNAWWNVTDPWFNNKVDKLLREAHKIDVAKLVGTPIEVEFERNLLKSWRVLTEVL